MLYKFGRIYHKELPEKPGYNDEFLQPPSFTITHGLIPHSPVIDTGFVVFSQRFLDDTLVVVSFALDGSDTSSTVIDLGTQLIFRPVIGYDPAGRLVIVGHEPWDYNGIEVGYRKLGSDEWHFKTFYENEIFPYGSPSLWVGNQFCKDSLAMLKIQIKLLTESAD